MDYKFNKENHDLWVSRMNSDIPEKVCSNDVALDKLESLQILDNLSNHSKILELGCGNGLLYEQIKKNIKYQNM